LTNFEEVIDSFNTKVENLRKEVTEAVSVALKTTLNEFYEKYPDVYAISWKQYIPGFNDGEPCEFSTTEPELFFTEKDYEEDGGVDSFYYIENYPENYPSNALVIMKDFLKISKAINKIDDTVLETAFGNNVKVTFFKDRLEIQEYDCGY